MTGILQVLVKDSHERALASILISAQKINQKYRVDSYLDAYHEVLYT